MDLKEKFITRKAMKARNHKLKRQIHEELFDV
jgi:hypothetical protein